MAPGNHAASGYWLREATSSTSSNKWYWSSSSLGCQRKWQSGSSATNRRCWIQPSNRQMIRRLRALGSENLFQLSRSLPAPRTCLFSQAPFSRSSASPTKRVGWGQNGVYLPESSAQGTTAGTNAASVSLLSPLESFDPLPATRAAGRSGSGCWHCRAFNLQVSKDGGGHNDPTPPT